jgi:hypothetical protein
MTKWADFAELRPDLVEAGAALLYQHGVGLAFLATSRADGGPRVHPMCPLLTSESMFAFIVPSPKQRDLLRDGRYAIHSFPRPDNEDAFYCAGTVEKVEDAAIRHRIGRQFVEERPLFPVSLPPEQDLLFEFDIETCLLTRTTGHGDPAPAHTVWRSK